MSRLLLTIVLGSAAAIGVAWYFELWPTAVGSDQIVHHRGPKKDLKLGKLLLHPPAEDARPWPASQQRPGPDAIIIPDCYVYPKDKQEVASPKDGQILFIGEEIFQEKANGPGGNLTVSLRVGNNEIIKTYRKLERGDPVFPGQLLAMLNPEIQLAELQAVRAKKLAAIADRLATMAILEESHQQVLRLDEARRGGGGKAVSVQEFSVAVATRDRYKQELASKAEAIKVAEAEEEKAATILRLYEIRNKMAGAGIIRAVKKYRGDMVKPQETILELYSLEHLRAEGQADVQYLNRLEPGTPVTLEPNILESPFRILPGGHHGEVTGVAILGRGKDLRIISSSEDRTVAVWGLSQAGGALRAFNPGEPVRAIACTQVSGRGWCLAGCADGGIRLYDLDGKDDKPRWEVKDPDKGAHRGPVTALAFDPKNGAFFASGGEDGMIHIWRTDNGSLLYAFNPEHGVDHPHEGAITALHVTPQSRLISAARDNTLRVWTLHENGATMDPRVVRGRGGNVANLGTSPDGGKMLFDQGRRLQVLSIPEGRTLCQIDGTFGEFPFETLAIYSPDASLVLTAGAPEGRLQLWKAPAPGARAYEVRQLATEERSPVTCAAFAPDVGSAADGSFAVSGTKDGNVYLWRMPTAQAVEHHRIEGLKLSLVDRALDANTRQVRIGVDVHNPVDEQHRLGILYGRLTPGRPVTVVIE
jgi:WD40 repeat protein